MYEMTYYYNMIMDDDGNYYYRYFNLYFTEPERTALLIYSNTILVGFAMINPFSYINENPDYVMAEFTVFPKYRRFEYGKSAVEQIFEQYRGKWELKYSLNNFPADSFWNEVTEKYHPQKFSPNEYEEVLSFSTEVDNKSRD